MRLKIINKLINFKNEVVRVDHNMTGVLKRRGNVDTERYRGKIL